MNILDMLLSDEQNSTVTDLSRQFGLSDAQTRQAVGELVPALSRGLQSNSNQPQGLDELLDDRKSWQIPR